MAVALTLTLIFLGGSWEVVWLACLAVEVGCGERVWFVRVFVKTFHQGSLRIGTSDGDGAF